MWFQYHCYKLTCLQAQFFPDKEFCHYNVFNHYFFDKENQQLFEEFMQDRVRDNVLVIVDPPFGGLVEVLLYTLDKIEHLWKNSEGWLQLSCCVCQQVPQMMMLFVVEYCVTCAYVSNNVNVNTHSGKVTVNIADKGLMPVFVFLPYFMEAKIKEHSSKYHMLDFKVILT